MQDWEEIYKDWPTKDAVNQAGRCMGCGVPFCHTGCPLGNLIPDWNHHVYANQWGKAVQSLLATNNFPEFTGRICPAPCEEACVLAINEDPVTIEHVEREIAEYGFANNLMDRSPIERTGKSVAVIGSGPAGLAAAQQLNSVGHKVVVFERDSYLGGLLTLGIPDFKLDKEIVFRRIKQLEAEGIEFKTNVNVGIDVDGDELLSRFDSVCLATGSNYPRQLSIPGSDLPGVVYAMDYLCQQIRINQGEMIPDDQLISAAGKSVVILGGGDTAADCLGTAHRQRAKEVHQFDIHEWPEERTTDNPWPYWPLIMRTRTTPAHDEGGIRTFNVLAKKIIGTDKVEGLQAVRLDWGEPDHRGRPEMIRVPNSEFDLAVDLIFVAIGFGGPSGESIIDQLGTKLDTRNMLSLDHNMMTSTDGVFGAGDVNRGMSLVVWAIAQGRDAARGIDKHLMGATTLPASAMTMSMHVGR